LNYLALCSDSSDFIKCAKSKIPIISNSLDIFQIYYSSDLKLFTPDFKSFPNFNPLPVFSLKEILKEDISVFSYLHLHEFCEILGLSQSLVEFVTGSSYLNILPEIDQSPVQFGMNILTNNGFKLIKTMSNGRKCVVTYLGKYLHYFITKNAETLQMTLEIANKTIQPTLESSKKVLTLKNILSSVFNSIKNHKMQFNSTKSLKRLELIMTNQPKKYISQASVKNNLDNIQIPLLMNQATQSLLIPDEIFNTSSIPNILDHVFFIAQHDDIKPGQFGIVIDKYDTFAFNEKQEKFFNTYSASMPNFDVSVMDGTKIRIIKKVPFGAILPYERFEESSYDTSKYYLQSIVDNFNKKQGKESKNIPVLVTKSLKPIHETIPKEVKVFKTVKKSSTEKDLLERKSTSNSYSDEISKKLGPIDFKKSVSIKPIASHENVIKNKLTDFKISSPEPKNNQPIKISPAEFFGMEESDLTLKFLNKDDQSKINRSKSSTGVRKTIRKSITVEELMKNL